MTKNHAQIMADFYSPGAQAKRLREDANRLDELAARAKCEGDYGDELACRAKATEARRKARRLEANS